MTISCLFFLPHFNLYSMLALVYLFNELLFLAAGFSWEKLVMSEIIIRGRYRSSLLLCISFVIRFHIDLYYSTRAVRDPSI